MAFRYLIKINGEEIDNVEIGFKDTIDFEEALDSGEITLIFKDKPMEAIMPYSFISIEISEYNNFYSTQMIEGERKDYLVIGSPLEQISKIKNVYRYKVKFVEYLEKFSTYFLDTFAFSRNIYSKRLAPFNYYNEDNASTWNSDDRFYVYNKRTYIPTIEKIFNTYKTNDVLHLNQVVKGRLIQTLEEPPLPPQNIECDVFIKTNAPILDNYQILSNNSVDWSFPIGKWEIEYGLILPPNDIMIPEKQGEITYFKYYIEVVSSNAETLYDIVMIIRDLISKFGGIESKKYYEDTRLFNLDFEEEEYLKSIEAPQMYIQNANIKLLLMFVFSYINALPKLIKGLNNNRDTLGIEYFNEHTGSFEVEDINEIGSEQNANQTGLVSYSSLKNVLPNDLNEKTTTLPSENEYITVRSSGIQLTDSNFTLKLPNGKPIYKPIKLVAEIEYYTYYMSADLLIETTGFNTIREIDLTDLLINRQEWALKLISTNFPSAYYSKLYSEEIGLANYRTENFYWNEGDTELNLSDTNGVLFKSNLLKSVLSYALRRDLTLDQLPPILDPNQSVYYMLDYQIYIDMFNGDDWYKNIKFRFEYITREEFSIKQDKEDLTQIDFYSELRDNQDETIINLNRASRKIYGNLQRSGNKNNTFMKVHTKLNERYKIGMEDSNGYKIVKIRNNYFNEHIISFYTVVKYHNRISQATFIDQTYRWRDNYAIELLNRNEIYSDYIMVMPYGNDNFVYDIESQNTKIYENTRDDIMSIIFGVLGIDKSQFGHKTKTRVNTALIRTDGFLEKYKDYQESVVNYFNFIYADISSGAKKQGLIFKFGFRDNQIAGDRLITKDNNIYNEAITYTNNWGELRFLDFYLLNDYEKEVNSTVEGNRIEGEFYNNYPLITNVRSITENSLTNRPNQTVYFGTGDLKFNDTADDSLLVIKDVMSNINIHYQINILSYFYGLIIFGKDFFNNNYLLKNYEEDKKVYIYLYDNQSPKYDIFEDLKIIPNYIGRHQINNNVFIRRLNNGNQLLYFSATVNNLITNSNHYAIGDEKGNLYFAVNENILSFEIIKRHFRPNIREIGDFVERGLNTYQFAIKGLISVNDNSINGGYTYNISIKAKTLIENILSFGDTYSFAIKGRTIIDSQFTTTKSEVYTIAIKGRTLLNNSISRETIPIIPPPKYNINIKGRTLLSSSVSTNKVGIKTATPSITNVSTIAENDYWYIQYRVRNNDLSTATIYSKVASASFQSRGTISYNASTSYITSQAISYSTSSVNVQAYASVSGKESSNNTGQIVYAPDRPIQITATPSIVDYTTTAFASNWQARYRVRNNDTQIATIFSGVGSASSSRGSIGSNAYTSYIIHTFNYNETSPTIYANALASGKNISASTTRTFTAPTKPEYMWFEIGNTCPVISMAVPYSLENTACSLSEEGQYVYSSEDQKCFRCIKT